jgi:preprotein translocase subunit Sec61beta
MSEPASANELVQVRKDGGVLQLDLPALVTLIQQKVLDAGSEVNSARLTRGEWTRLGELELFRTLQPAATAASHAPLPPGLATAGEPEANLVQFFQSLTLNQLRVDSAIALIAGLLVAVLGMVAHRGLVLVPLLVAAGWSVGMLYAGRVVFPRWFARVRSQGFRRLPWSSRTFGIVAVALFCYLLAVLFLPELPGERWFRLIDCALAVLFGAAGGTVWAFRYRVTRMKRTYERLGAAAKSDTASRGVTE